MKPVDWTRLLGFDQARRDDSKVLRLSPKIGAKDGFTKPRMASVGARIGAKTGAKPV